MDFRSDNVSGVHPAVIDAIARRQSRSGGSLRPRRVDPAARAALRRALRTPRDRDAGRDRHRGQRAGAGDVHAALGGDLLPRGRAHQRRRVRGARFLQRRRAPGRTGRRAGEARRRRRSRAAIQREGDVHANQPRRSRSARRRRSGPSIAPASSPRSARRRAGTAWSCMSTARASRTRWSAPARRRRADLEGRRRRAVVRRDEERVHGRRRSRAVRPPPPNAPASSRYRRKRGGHLISKSRFLAAQLEAYLTGDLWLRNARHANAAAQRLAAGLERVLGVPPAEAVEANEIFIALGAAVAKALRAGGFLFHDWPGIGDGGARLVTSWDTSDEAVDALVAAAARARGAT